MSGGSGTRLWPLSNDETPKQFHALFGEHTLIQDTVRRLTDSDAVEVAAPLIICNQRHAGLVREQLAQAGVRPAGLILEPFGRNTAPAAAVAALAAQALDSDALVLLMAADHVIADPAAFSAAVAGCMDTARDHIVTFGVTPTGPETGFGYIEAGAVINGEARKVARFAEKPDLATAKAYVAGGRHLWNAGIFLFSPQIMLAELDRLAPAVLAASQAAFDRGRRSGTDVDLDPEAFAACPSISVDYAVMEATDKAAVAPIGSAWADVGSWSELWRLGPRDDRDNFVRGDAALIDVNDCLIWAQDKTVAAVGLRDLIIVQAGDAVLVLPKDRAQEVKALVEQLKARQAGG